MRPAILRTAARAHWRHDFTARALPASANDTLRVGWTDEVWPGASETHVRRAALGADRATAAEGNIFAPFHSSTDSQGLQPDHV